MKSKIALLAVTLALSSGAFAQGAPASIMDSTVMGNVAKWIGTRVAKVDFHSQMADMQKNGIKEKTYLVGFSASGALVYNNEFDHESPEDVLGKYPGIQLLPYKVSFNNDGSRAIEFSGVGWREMIAHQDSDSITCTDQDMFDWVDNLNLVGFKWDKKMALKNVESFDFNLVDADIKLDILGADSGHYNSLKNEYLAITAGATLGWSKKKITLDSGEVVETARYIDDKGKPTGLGFQPGYRAGLEYYKSNEKGSSIKVKAGIVNTQYKGEYFDKGVNEVMTKENSIQKEKYDKTYADYQTNKLDWETGKKDWEEKYSKGQVISTSSYETISGTKLPKAPNGWTSLDYEGSKVVMDSMVFAPSVTLTKKIKNKPAYLELELSSQIQYGKNKIVGGAIDQKLHNGNAGNVALRFKF